MSARALLIALLLVGCPGSSGTLGTDDDDAAVTDDDDVADDDDVGDDDSGDDDDSAGDDDDSTEPPPVLVINELVSNNAGAVLDDLGEASDWLEIHNASDAAVSLEGYRISDDWTVQDLHVLPAGLVVPAQGYLVLWADGSEVPATTHLPFRLSSEGEAVGLFDPSGGVVDWVEFPALGDDEAWARIPDGGEAWQVVSLGTPGAANIAGQLGTVSLFETGATWSYLDSGVAPDPSWTTVGFDDTTWAAGPAPLGYGDPVTTEISYGGNAGAKHITSWFRLTFEADAATAAATQLDLSLRVDDSVLLWLNGEELLRVNLPAGPIDADTLSAVTVSGAAETAYTAWEAPTTALVAGTNVLAAEVHQVSPSSSDVSFDLGAEAEVWIEERQGR